ncbi:MAG: CoF synthetase, partial [Bacteroidota bacterium]
MEENKKPVVALTNSERFPLLSDLSYLNKLKQDQFAPKFNFQSGDRLFRHHLQQVQAYAEKLNSKPPVNEGASPGWLDHYLQWCIETVPFYKNRKSHFEEQPTIGRGDLHRAPWKFVSADCDLEDMLVYQTSGTTGSAMDVVFDPVSQACWIPQLESVLDSYGIKLSRGPYVTAIALICDQQSTLTYPSLSSYLEGAGILKINLNVSDWNDAGHRLKYLEKYNPEVLTGDPFAFLSLLALTPRLSPKALVSSAMKMTQGIKEKLEAYFKCPVLD